MGGVTLDARACRSPASAGCRPDQDDRDGTVRTTTGVRAVSTIVSHAPRGLDTGPEPEPGPGATVHRASAFASWPLTLLVVGFPLWWLLGLGAVFPLLVAVPMAWQLVRTRSVRLPKGTGWWALFLVWVLASVTMLWVDAPGAVPGGGPSRLLVYGFRLAWYLACTVVLVWMANADEESVPTRRVVDLLGLMFVVTVLGGLLGTFAPRFEITSPVQMVLPGAIASNGFVRELIHPQAATASTFLGYEAYRPTAPFAFANSWGANLAMFAPFFLVSWFRRGAGWRRVVGVLVLVAAALPIVYSLNRALWAALGVGALYAVGRLALRGHLRGFLVAVGILTLAGAAFAASPLADETVNRLSRAHSNDRRSDLLVLTVTSTLEGSPVAGYGSTRDVQGGFASIAAGSTPDCPACGVPPLGTQGLLWTVIFAHGLVGAALFLAFLVRSAAVSWRSRTAAESLATVSLLFFAITLPVYDTLGMPLFTLMLALGMAWRERATAEPAQDQMFASAWEWLIGHRRTLVAVTAVGLVAGVVVAVQQPVIHTAKTSLLLTPVPVSLDPETGAARRSGAITIDTEAALVVSGATLSALTDDPDEQQRLRSRISVTAPPNSDVLTIHVKDTDADEAIRTADVIARSYLTVREDYLALRREQVLQQLEDQLASVVTLGQPLGGDALDDSDIAVSESKLREYIDQVERTPTAAGELIRAAASQRARAEVEVPVVSATLLALLVAVAISWITPGTPSSTAPVHPPIGRQRRRLRFPPLESA